MITQIGKPLLLIALIGASACEDDERSTTESDAIELGAERIRCPAANVDVVYAFMDTVPKSTVCAAVEISRFEAGMSGLVPREALAEDSVDFAVVSFLTYAPYPSPPQERLGRDVTFELRHRNFNLRVVAQPGRQLEVTWAPEGLKY